MTDEGDRFDHSFILDNLILSGAKTTTSRLKLTELRVTHMLSVDIGPIIPHPVANYMNIQANDHSEEDLVSHFPLACNFIGQALDQVGNVVFVHCNQGRSRSAAVVIAYIMSSMKMTSDEALQYVQHRRPEVNPNDGFREQLNLWQFMNYKLDVTNTRYRQIVLVNLCYKFRRSTIIPLGRSPDIPRKLEGNDETELRHRQDYLVKYFSKLRVGEQEFIDKFKRFVCSECGTELFRQIHILIGVTEIGKFVDQLDNCKDLYIEPQEWMIPFIATEMNQGPLYCYKCKMQLGEFDWNGLRIYGSSLAVNQSHRSHIPAFKIHATCIKPSSMSAQKETDKKIEAILK
ncbi:Dual specificity protein phosphatase 12 [Halotydeus destructor]|nr:Dual specificity protein phosphatase 12 [Halotydeus destructor]